MRIECQEAIFGVYQKSMFTGNKSRIQDYINTFPDEFNQELKDISIGDLLYDPYYGFGVLCEMIDTIDNNFLIKFYHSDNSFYIEGSQIVFLKKNLIIMQNVEKRKKQDKNYSQTEDLANLYSIY
jgi:hypothetical protein